MAKLQSLSPTAILQSLLLFTQGFALESFNSRVLQADNSTGLCTDPLATYITTDKISTAGIVFAVQSVDTDTVGPTVVSMGFHVDSSLMTGSSFQYEVYALNVDGYYADPDRGDDILSALGFDYRGQLDQWTLVASGDIYQTDLEVGISTPFSTKPEYYEIPIDSFIATTIPPNGGQRSFYATLTQSGMILAEPGDLALNDESTLAAGDQGGIRPKILVGEGVINYPFTATTYLYSTKVFIGKVILQKECPTDAPSYAPSDVPSESPSDFPSTVPSFTPTSPPSFTPSYQPSAIPSVILSDTPSTAPTLKVEEVRSALLLSLNGPECTFDAAGNPIEMTKAEQDAVAETVKANAEADAESNDVYNMEVTIAGQNIDCGRRLSGYHRQLPSGAAAVEFSMIITGEYRPPVIPGVEAKPVSRGLDLGAIAEDSINRDPEAFVRDLKDRAPPNSSLNEVQSLDVEAVEAPPEGVAEVVFTKKPTPQPTSPPFQSTILLEEPSRSTEKTILLACILLTTVVVIILASFLMFRFASRRAVRRYDEEMERREKKREQAQRRRMKKYNEAHVEWADDMNETNSRPKRRTSNTDSWANDMDETNPRPKRRTSEADGNEVM